MFVYHACLDPHPFAVLLCVCAFRSTVRALVLLLHSAVVLLLSHLKEMFEAPEL